MGFLGNLGNFGHIFGDNGEILFFIILFLLLFDGGGIMRGFMGKGVDGDDSSSILFFIILFLLLFFNGREEVDPK